MILKGTEISKNLLINLKNKISLLDKKPGLAIISIGDNPASKIYIQKKMESALSVGIDAILYEFPISLSNTSLIKHIIKLNNDNSIDGIIVQLPLPPHFNKNIILSTISPDKDVDGFHPLNRGKLSGVSNFIPATPKGILKLLKETNTNFEGKRCLIIGRSDIVGLPISILLSNDSEIGRMTIIMAQIWEKNLKELCLLSDIIIVAAGVVNLIPDETYIKDGAIVIDVGINRIDNKVVGDTNFEKIKDKCSFITPVPGGVGPLTVACLLENVIESYERRNDNRK